MGLGRGVPERDWISFEESLTPQAGRGRPGRWVSAAASAWQACAAVRAICWSPVAIASRTRSGSHW